MNASSGKTASSVPATRNQLLEAIRGELHPIYGKGGREDYDPLLSRIRSKDPTFVLIGEASHGTHEFYKNRAEITKRLIKEQGFKAVTLEADWPDSFRVNRYVRGLDHDAVASEALGDFKRFPTWMWRNADMLDFVGWLRAYNEHLPVTERVGIYGLDMYSLFSSMQVVLNYLQEVDPPAAERARARYSCWDHFEDPQQYGVARALNITESCRDKALEQLTEMANNNHKKARDERTDADPVKEEERFNAEMNARVVVEAERYYSAMFTGKVNTWNLRDGHMIDTLDRVSRHIAATYHGRGPDEHVKAVVWEHNSHVGDARATQHAIGEQVTVGQLARERFGADDCFLVGFTTHKGTVTAAENWDRPALRRRVRDSLPNSYERTFHDAQPASEGGPPGFLLDLTDPSTKAAQLLAPAQLERAIGVVYRPETERQSHYIKASLPKQFDSIIHLDETRAVEPLETTAQWHKGELPDTYPYGL